MPCPPGEMPMLCDAVVASTLPGALAAFGLPLVFGLDPLPLPICCLPCQGLDMRRRLPAAAVGACHPDGTTPRWLYGNLATSAYTPPLDAPALPLGQVALELRRTVARWVALAAWRARALLLAGFGLQAAVASTLPACASRCLP